MPHQPLHRSSEQTDLLQRLLRRFEETDGAVAVFDLDGCLFDNRPRQVQILREFAAQRGLDALSGLSIEHFEDWDLRRTFQNLGLDSDLIDALHDDARRHWLRHFFRSEYCLYDHAMPGAPRFVWSIYERGGYVVYLTGRDEEMRLGTETSLLRFGFPLRRPRTELIMKPFFHVSDAAFKQEALREIATLGQPDLFLDNEPTNLNIFHDHFPDAQTIMVETDHSPEPVVPYDHLPRIKGFLID